MADDSARAEINRLYWESDASVSDIADRVGVSRRALYDQLEPLPAGVPCPDCGAPLGYRNRTAAENREAECEACGFEEDLAGKDIAATDADGPDTDGSVEPQVEQEARAGRMAPLRPVPTSGRSSGPVLGGSMLAGLALGAAVGWVIRRR